MTISAQSAHHNVVVTSKSPPAAVESFDLCIIGDGASSLAAACILSTGGHNVRFSPIRENEKSFAAFVDRLPLEYELRGRGASVSSQRSIAAYGSVSIDLAAAVKDADGIIICQPLTEYGALADRLAAILVNGQTICLCNAPLGAALQFKQLMRCRNKNLQIKHH